MYHSVPQVDCGLDPDMVQCITASRKLMVVLIRIWLSVAQRPQVDDVLDPDMIQCITASCKLMGVLIRIWFSVAQRPVSRWWP